MTISSTAQHSTAQGNFYLFSAYSKNVVKSDGVFVCKGGYVK